MRRACEAPSCSSVVRGSPKVGVDACSPKSGIKVAGRNGSVGRYHVDTKAVFHPAVQPTFSNMEVLSLQSENSRCGYYWGQLLKLTAKHFDFELPDDPRCLEELEEMREFFGLEA